MRRQLFFILLMISIQAKIATPFVFAQVATSGDTETGFSPQPDSRPIEVEFRAMDSLFYQGAERSSILLRIAMRLKITNRSDVPISISRSQFDLLSGGTKVEAGTYQSEPELKARSLKPGESTEGFIWFGGLTAKGAEPRLELVWTPRRTRADNAAPATRSDDDGKDDVVPEDPVSNNPGDGQAEDDGKTESLTPTIRIPLNDVFDRMNAPEITSLGPDGCLIQISVPRLLDPVAMWSMSRTLERLAKDGHQRILIISQPQHKVQVMDEFITWLSTLVEGQGQGTGAANGVSGNLPLPKTIARFKSINLAGITQTANRRFYGGRRNVRMYETIDEAIFESLMPLYRFVPVDKALADLQNPLAGVQRAAIAGAVDRLNETQAAAIIEKAKTGNEVTQLLIVSYLNLIPGRSSVETLKTLALGPNSKVSAAAIDALCACPDDSAIAAMAEVWTVSESTPELRSVILGAIGRHPDERWVPLAKDYVATFLAKADQPDPPEIQPQSIGSALALLKDLERVQVAKLVAAAIPNVRNMDLQDTLLAFLTTVDLPDRAPVIRQVVSQRVSKKEFSTAVMQAARLFPDSAWTIALFEAGISKQPIRGYEKTIRPALACADDSQLEIMISKFDSMDVQQQFELVSHLSKTGHRGWQDLSCKVLDHKDRFSQETVQLLANDASEDSLRVLRNQLEKYVKELEGTKDASTDGTQYFVKIGPAVAMFSHPECRRTINRLARDPNTWVAESVSQWKLLDIRNSPALEFIVAENNAREAGENDKVSELIRKRIEADPFLPNNYIRRASEHMHAKRFTESMEDLQTADRLSPEDIEVLSMIALVKVRLNETEAGLKMADEVIAMAPKDWTSVYNGACSYSRATENDVPADKKSAHADKAIELLASCAKDLKFKDVKHMLKDEDLVALYTHPKWSETVELARANEAIADPP
jgi:tetratricopeptide (TPR) repeat protein